VSVFYPRPESEQIYEEFAAVEGACSACGKEEVKSYKVLRSTGWRRLVRCRGCFHEVSSEPINQSYVPLTDGWDTSDAG
jgi:hypothetical protein